MRGFIFHVSFDQESQNDVNCWTSEIGAGKIAINSRSERLAWLMIIITNCMVLSVGTPSTTAIPKPKRSAIAFPFELIDSSIKSMWYSYTRLFYIERYCEKVWTWRHRTSSDLLSNVDRIVWSRRMRVDEPCEGWVKPVEVVHSHSVVPGGFGVRS